MTAIEQIRCKIETIYQAIKEPKVNVPLALQVRQWISFAEDYIGAASILEREAPQHWLPLLQMTGQAVESSLKVCLAAANIDPPNHHDQSSFTNLRRNSALDWMTRISQQSTTYDTFTFRI